MTRWTAVIPLKNAGDRKSRLSPVIAAAGRALLAEALYRHVANAIMEAGLFDQVLVLSPSPPPIWGMLEWQGDGGRPVNESLTRLRPALNAPMMVMNADLPLVAPADIEALVRGASQNGCAIAPDRHGSGTNAVALLAGKPFAFAFGEDSFGRHRASAGPDAWIVERVGLAHDLDRVEDIEALASAVTPLPDAIRDLLQEMGALPPRPE